MFNGLRRIFHTVLGLGGLPVKNGLHAGRAFVALAGGQIPVGQ